MLKAFLKKKAGVLTFDQPMTKVKLLNSQKWENSLDILPANTTFLSS